MFSVTIRPFYQYQWSILLEVLKIFQVPDVVMIEVSLLAADRTSLAVLAGTLVASIVRRLAKAERHVLVLNHMPNLPLHGDHKENDEVQEEDGPEHRHVEYAKEGHEEGSQHSSRA